MAWIVCFEPGGFVERALFVCALFRFVIPIWLSILDGPVVFIRERRRRGDGGILINELER